MGLAIVKKSKEDRIVEQGGEKETPRHILNRKADKKLEYVADQFSIAMDEKFSGRKTKLLHKTLYCHGFHHLTNLDLAYTYENRFWAISYNLNVRTSIDVSEQKKENAPCRFLVKNKGKLGITDAEWLDNGSKCDAIRTKRYLSNLNHQLIIDRIVSLDLTKVEVVFDPNTEHWTIRCSTLIGSTTWVLIPPLMQLIKPTPTECVKMIEFLELVADAVIHPDNE